ncbi:unnamed protein product [Cylindrotheca closterium]|uniref:Uncharacterized protein n=1 Tax=Cylindrotheca closterium TaxID=2856 RepID=A0AAD2FF38_9STRA|nr:unnamed protein product [Cylindrotheca closterium]
MIPKRDFPISKELEVYALAVVNFVCCHSYAQTTTDDCEYIRIRSPTIPPKWMGDSPHADKVSITNFNQSKGYKTGIAEGARLCQHRDSSRMLDTNGFPPRPSILSSPGSESTWTVASWNSANWKPETTLYSSRQSVTSSVASSSADSSIFGHPVYSLQTFSYEE